MCFMDAGRKSLYICVCMEIDFNFVCVEIDLISVWKIELDLIPVQDGIDLFGHCV